MVLFRIMFLAKQDKERIGIEPELFSVAYRSLGGIITV
jgi:hypothetical protein